MTVLLLDSTDSPELLMLSMGFPQVSWAKKCNHHFPRESDRCFNMDIIAKEE